MKRVVELVVVQDTNDTNNISGYSGTVIPEGGSAKLKAIALFQDGTADDVTSKVAWSSSDPDTAEVNQQGWVKAEASGAVKIIASKDGVSFSYGIRVTDAVLASIELTSHEIILNKGEQELLRAKGWYTDGSSRYLDPNDSVIWISSHPTIASVDDIGLVTALEPSEIQPQISASVGDIESSNTTKVTVLDRALSEIKVRPEQVILPKSTSTQLSAVGIYTDGSESDITDQVHWVEEDSDIVRARPSGELEGLEVGETSVTATLKINSELTAVSFVEVTETNLLSIQITPATVELPVGFRHQFTATGEFDDGVNRDITSAVTWKSSDALRAEIDNSGELTAKSVGVAQISATLDSVTSNTSQVFVNSSVLEKIDLTPLDIQLPVNQDASVTAQGVMSDGSVLNVSSLVAWYSNEPAIASVDDVGHITAISDGNAKISAYLDGIESTIPLQVTVIDAALESIVLTTSHTDVNIGMGIQLEAIGVYSDGLTFDLTDKVSWISNDASIATVDHTGMVYGVSEGVASIEASYGGITSLIPTKVSVLPALLTDIKITSDAGSDTIVAGYDKTYKATGVFSDGAEKPLADSDVSWLSSDVEVATVSPSGEVKGVKVGTAVITALNGDITSSEPITITVTEAELVSISVEAQDNEIPMGLTTKVTARGEFSDGSVVESLLDVVWSSNNDLLATVDQDGVVTGVASGTVTIAAKRFNTSGLEISGATSMRISNKTLVGMEINPFSFNGDPKNDGWLPNKMPSVQLTADYIYSDGSRERAPSSNLHWYNSGTTTGLELYSDGKARSNTSYQAYNRTIRVIDDHHNGIRASKSVRTGDLGPDGELGKDVICGKLSSVYSEIPSNACISVLPAGVEVGSQLVMSPLSTDLTNSHGLEWDYDSQLVTMPDGYRVAIYASTLTDKFAAFDALCKKMNQINLYGFDSWGYDTTATDVKVPVLAAYDALFDYQGSLLGKWPGGTTGTTTGYYMYDAYRSTTPYPDYHYRIANGSRGSGWKNQYFIGCSVTPYPEMPAN